MNAVVPPNFPAELTAAAFVNGKEAAWEQKDCLETIEWLSKKGYAVLGFELWLPEDGGIRRSDQYKSWSWYLGIQLRPEGR